MYIYSDSIIFALVISTTSIIVRLKNYFVICGVYCILLTSRAFLYGVPGKLEGKELYPLSTML